jgi:hypothetical protein
MTYHPSGALPSPSSASSVRLCSQGRFRTRRSEKLWARRTRAFTVFHGMIGMPQQSAPIASALTIICSISSSSSPLIIQFILVTRLGGSPSRQAPPGCKEGPIYLSGRRPADSRRPPRRREETGLRTSAVVIQFHCPTTPTFCRSWVSPSRPRAQRKPVPWVCNAMWDLHGL